MAEGSLAARIGPGLRNPIGTNSCYLNAVLQHLLHTPEFTTNLNGALSAHNCPTTTRSKGNCVVCLLVDLKERANDLPCRSNPYPKLLRTLLFKSKPASFPWEKTADATEAFTHIVELLHSALVKTEETEDQAPQPKSCDCFGCSIWSMDFTQEVKCVACNESLVRARTEAPVLTLPVTSLTQDNADANTPSPSFCTELLNQILEARTVKCENKECNTDETASTPVTTVHLQHMPTIISIGLTWTESHTNNETLLALSNTVPYCFPVQQVFGNVDAKKTAVITGVILYHNVHYRIMLYSEIEKAWVLYDDATCKLVGKDWLDVWVKIVRATFQPFLLFYRVHDNPLPHEAIPPAITLQDLQEGIAKREVVKKATKISDQKQTKLTEYMDGKEKDKDEFECDGTKDHKERTESTTKPRSLLDLGRTINSKSSLLLPPSLRNLSGKDNNLEADSVDVQDVTAPSERQVQIQHLLELCPTASYTEIDKVLQRYNDDIGQAAAALFEWMEGGADMDSPDSQRAVRAQNRSQNKDISSKYFARNTTTSTAESSTPISEFRTSSRRKPSLPVSVPGEPRPAEASIPTGLSNGIRSPTHTSSHSHPRSSPTTTSTTTPSTPHVPAYSVFSGNTTPPSKHTTTSFHTGHSSQPTGTSRRAGLSPITKERPAGQTNKPTKVIKANNAPQFWTGDSFYVDDKWLTADAPQVVKQQIKRFGGKVVSPVTKKPQVSYIVVGATHQGVVKQGLVPEIRQKQESTGALVVSTLWIKQCAERGNNDLNPFKVELEQGENRKDKREDKQDDERVRKKAKANHSHAVMEIADMEQEWSAGGNSGVSEQSALVVS